MLTRRFVLSMVAVCGLVLSSAGAAEACLFGGCGGGFGGRLFGHHNGCCDCGCDSCGDDCGCDSGCDGGCGCGEAHESSAPADEEPAAAAPAAPESQQ